MYILEEFGDMIADQARFGAYADAIHRAVHPGDVVVDLGCGPGIFALLTCRAGAKRVYAIDTGDVIYFAKKLAIANGFEDRIEFLHGDSRQMQLAERANVLVSDVRGALPLFADGLPSIEDARKRFLARGGVQIPVRDTVYAAVVETPQFYKRLTSPWKDSGRDVDFTAALSPVLNSVCKIRSQSAQLLTEPQTWCTLEYTKQLNFRAGAQLLFRATRSGTAHGVTAWFETQLFEDIGFSTAPGNMGTIYGQGFLPWPEPVALEEGQEVEVDFTPIPSAGIIFGAGTQKSQRTTAALSRVSFCRRFKERSLPERGFGNARLISFQSLRNRARQSTGFLKPWMEARHCRKSRMRPRNGSRMCFSGRMMHSSAFRRWPKDFPASTYQRTFR
jgi:protein arginine N-methyltransferase 1